MNLSISNIAWLPKDRNKIYRFLSKEKIEGIELLRAIENDLSIGTFVAKGSSFGVNVKQDLLRAIDEMSRNKIRKLY